MIITIDPQGDLIVKVVEKSRLIRTPDGIARDRIVGRDLTVQMNVNRKVLVDNSIHFKVMLSGSFVEAQQNTIELHEDTVNAMLLWFRAIHGVLDPPGMLELTVTEVWDVVAAGRKYHLHIEHLQPWFSRWFPHKASVRENARGIATPALAGHPLGLALLCFEFDDAEAFAFETRGSAYYETGKEVELGNPTEHTEIQLPSRIFHQLNAVRGTLANKIHRELFRHLHDFQERSCACRFEATFNYVTGLKEASAFGDVNMKGVRIGNEDALSIIEQIEKLDLFRYNPPANSCYHCSQDFKRKYIMPIKKDILDYFNGLCLDCLHASQEDNNSYWKCDFPGHHGYSCRVKNSTTHLLSFHGQPTWYFSYMGRPDVRDAHRKDYLLRKDKGMDMERKDVTNAIKEAKKAKKERKDEVEAMWATTANAPQAS